MSGGFIPLLFDFPRLYTSAPLCQLSLYIYIYIPEPTPRLYIILLLSINALDVCVYIYIGYTANLLCLPRRLCQLRRAFSPALLCIYTCASCLRALVLPTFFVCVKMLELCRLYWKTFALLYTRPVCARVCVCVYVCSAKLWFIVD